ncbi:MAG: TonB-dependent receptor domain-containing protein [Alishewanella aestuarii]
MNNVKHKLWQCSTLSLLLSSPILFAGQTTTNDNEIERIEVRAKPEGWALLDYAGQSAAREVRDLFAGVTDISIGGGDRQGRRLFLRGAEGSNLNITVDGARQGPNLYNHRGGMLGVDPAILKLVRIHAGPARAEDGAGAMAGSVQFTTKDAQDFVATGQQLGGFVRAAYASAQSAETLNSALALQHQAGLGVLLYAGGTNASEQRIGGGDKIPYSGYDDRNVLIKLSYLGEHSVRLGHEVNRTKGLNFQQRGDYPYQVQPPAQNRPPRLQTLQRESSTLDYSFRAEQDWFRPQLVAYQQKTSWESPDNLGEAFYSTGKGVTLKNTLLLSDYSKVLLGIDFLSESGDAEGNNLPSKQDVIDYNNTGVFFQTDWQMAELLFTAGVRRDHYQTVYGSDEVSGYVWSPNVQAQWQLHPHWQLFAGYGSSARGFGTIPVHFARNIQTDVQAPAKAERAQQQEAGIRLAEVSLGSGYLTAELAYFNNKLRDFILYTHGGSGGLGNRPVVAFSNQDEVISFEGVNIKLGLHWVNWFTELNYNHTSSRNLPEQPQHSARAGALLGDKVHWRLGQQLNQDWHWSYQLTVQQGISIDANDRKTGYSTHDLNLNWQVLPDLELTLALHNLTDKRYISHSTLRQNGFATEEPGRDLRFAVRYQF